MARRKIAIIGYTDHRVQAPFFDQEWEIWGLNDLYYELPENMGNDRLRWFQLHGWHEIAHWADKPVTADPLNFSGGPPHPRDPNHVGWLKWASELFPVYLLKARPELPAAQVFPFEAACQYFSLDGKTALRYFTNTISYMIALAIMEDAEEIGLYGIDMMMGGGDGSEYGWQRPSCEFFIGVAQGRGIKVHIPAESDLLKSAFQYGSETGNEFRKKLDHMAGMYRGRQNELTAQINQLSAGKHHLQGALETLDWIRRSWMPGDSESPSKGRAPLPNTHKELARLLPQATAPTPSQVQVDVNLDELGDALLKRMQERGKVLVASDGKEE